VRRRASSGPPGPIDSAPWWGIAAGVIVAVLLLDDPACKRVNHDSGTWDCSVPEPGGSGGSGAYRVTMGDRSCWDADRTGSAIGDGIHWPAHLSGCVKIKNDLRLFG
jgi:hypothetical protein